MTTPLCNEGCSDSVGWLPETSWPFGTTTKSSAQPIYCLSGTPYVPPRGLFKANYADARQDSLGSGRLLSSTNAVANLAGATSSDLTISNTTAYDLHAFGFWSSSIQALSIESDAVVNFVTSIYDVTTGTPVLIVSSTQTEYGVDSTAVSPWRHMRNDNFYFLKSIAPASSAVFRIRTTWTKTLGTYGANDKMNDFRSALRVITGNA
jgi:hypothetical protein